MKIDVEITDKATGEKRVYDSSDYSDAYLGEPAIRSDTSGLCLRMETTAATATGSSSLGARLALTWTMMRRLVAMNATR